MIYAIVVVLVLIADQALKYYTVSNIVLNTGEVPLIDGLVHLTHVHNYGAAFSIMQNTRWLLVALTAVFVIVVIYALSAELIQGRLGRWSAVLVLAGALGNAIDRLFIGYVVDMIEVEFMSFPVFNIADIFVTCAGIAFCFYIAFHKSPEPAAGEKVSLGERVRRAREKEPERHGGDIEMIRKGARRPEPVKIPEPEPIPEPVKAPVRAPAPKFDPNDPFAEWEKAPKAEPAPEPVVVKAGPASAPAPKAEPEYIPQPVAESVPARKHETVVVDDMEFDIDDILAEFK